MKLKNRSDELENRKTENPCGFWTSTRNGIRKMDKTNIRLVAMEGGSAGGNMSPGTSKNIIILSPIT